MRLFICWLSILVTFFFLGRAQAAVGEITGNDIYRFCTAEDNYSQGMCIGLVYGFTQGQNAGYTEGIYASVGGIYGMNDKSLDTKTMIKEVDALNKQLKKMGTDVPDCAPHGVTTQQMIDLVVKWLRDNPKFRSSTMEFAFNRALIDAYGFPCDLEKQ